MKKEGKNARNTHTTKIHKIAKLETIIHKQRTSKTENEQTKQYEKKKVYKSTTEFVLCWPCTAEHEAYP